MSLDIYLYDKKTLTCDCGKVHEIETNKVHWQNITHNLGKMAEEAGIYYPLWHLCKDGVDIKTPAELSHILTPAIKDMDTRPDHYRKFNAKNGWGTYEDFVPWLEKLRDACNDYPNSIITVSR